MPSGKKPAETVSLSEFAADWKVTVRTVTNWLADGMPSRMVDGQRRVVRSEANAWKLAKAEAEVVTKDPTSEAEARARKLAAEARLAELELAGREGSMVAVDEAVGAVESRLAALRSQLVTLPARVAPVVLGCKTLAEVTGKLDAAVAEAMASIAEGTT